MIRHVLLIDDEPDIRAVAEVSLSHIGGWRVSQAGSGEEGLALAHQEPPDVVLLDVMMSGVDGPETLRRLLMDDELANIPVLFLTAESTREDIARLMQLGAAGVLVKPFDPLELPARVRAALSER